MKCAICDRDEKSSVMRKVKFIVPLVEIELGINKYKPNKTYRICSLCALKEGINQIEGRK